MTLQNHSKVGLTTIYATSMFPLFFLITVLVRGFLLLRNEVLKILWFAERYQNYGHFIKPDVRIIQGHIKLLLLPKIYEGYSENNLRLFCATNVGTGRARACEVTSHD